MGTGKPKNKRRTPEEVEAQKRADRKALAELGPLENLVRCTVAEGRLIDHSSLPVFYRKLRSGEIENYVEDGRRWIVVSSLLRLRLPPDERPKIKKRRKFVPIKSTPHARLEFQAATSGKAHAEA